MAKKNLVMDVRTTQKIAFNGEKIAGGTVLSAEEFKRLPTSRIEMFGTIKGTDQEVMVALTPKNCGRGEFMALDDIITREGTFECIGEITNTIEINGEVVKEFDTPHINVDLSDEDGNALFKFTPKPVAKWAEKYGNFVVEPIDRGRDVDANKAFAELRRGQRSQRIAGNKSGSSL